MYNSDFNQYFQDVVPKINSCIKRPKSCPDKNLDFNATVKNVYFPQKTEIPPEWQCLTNGFYSILLKEWVETFSKEKIILVDGDQVTKNLPEVIIKMERKMGLPRYFQRENFQINPQNGFWCYHPQGLKGPRMCLSDFIAGKGKTRGLDAKDKIHLSSQNQKALEELYRPYNRELRKTFGINFPWAR